MPKEDEQPETLLVVHLFASKFMTWTSSQIPLSDNKTNASSYIFQFSYKFSTMLGYKLCELIVAN